MKTKEKCDIMEIDGKPVEHKGKIYAVLWEDDEQEYNICASCCRKLHIKLKSEM